MQKYRTEYGPVLFCDEDIDRYRYSNLNECKGNSIISVVNSMQKKKNTITGKATLTMVRSCVLTGLVYTVHSSSGRTASGCDRFDRIVFERYRAVR